MKKLLITISPICVILFATMWISWGAEGVLAFLGSMLYIVALSFGTVKWMDFVDKHIKD